MSWTFTAVFALQALAVVAVLVVLPGGAATVAVVGGRVAGRAATLRRAVVIAGYALSAVVLVSLGVFLLVNQVRVVGFSQL